MIVVFGGAGGAGGPGDPGKGTYQGPGGAGGNASVSTSFQHDGDLKVVIQGSGGFGGSGTPAGGAGSPGGNALAVLRDSRITGISKSGNQQAVDVRIDAYGGSGSGDTASVGRGGDAEADVVNNTFVYAPSGGRLYLEIGGWVGRNVPWSVGQPAPQQTAKLVFTDNTFTGGLGDDTLDLDASIDTQGSSNVTILATSFGNTFDGGDGSDILILHGNAANYQVRSVDGGFALTDTVKCPGISLFLKNVEQIRFSDFAFSLTQSLLPPKIVNAPINASAMPVPYFGVSPENTVIGGNLSASHPGNYYSFDLDYDSEITWQVALKDNPSNTRSFTLDYRAGKNTIEVLDDHGYAAGESYVVTVKDIKRTGSDGAPDIDKFASTLGQEIATGQLDTADLLNTLLKEFGSKDIVPLAKKLNGIIGKVGYGIDGAFRIADILNAKDSIREFVVQLADFSASLVAGGFGAFAGGLAGIPFFAQTLGSSIGLGMVGGRVAGQWIYQTAASDYVKWKTGKYYDQYVAQHLGGASMIALASAGTSAETVTEPATIAFDAAWYLSTYSDARAAVASGQYGSALHYYLVKGIQLGEAPNATSGVIPVTDLAYDPSSYTNWQTRGGVFEVTLGSMTGDGASVEERQLLTAIKTSRTASIATDAALFAAANRKAMDLVQNFALNAEVNQAYDGDAWAQAWSNGKAFGNGYIALTSDNSNAVMMAVASHAESADDVWQTLRNNFNDVSKLVASTYTRIGIAEYGGVWVVILADGVSKGDVTLDGTPNTIARRGSEYADVLSLGTWQGTIDGDGGDDVLIGSSYGDALNGGDGDDWLTAASGNDTLSGGLGTNTLDGGAGTDTAVFAGKPSDYYVTANADGSYAVKSPTETDTVRDIEQFAFANGQTLSLAQFQAQQFNGLTYIASYGDLIAAFGADAAKGVAHYFDGGWAEGRTVSFNALAYIASYSDLIQAFGDDQAKATLHWINSGWKEGRNIHFSALNYIASYSDLIQAYGDDQTKGFEHWIAHGWREGRDVSFDPLNYIASYSDLIKALGNNPVAGAEHWINSGWKEGRNSKFDAMSYIASYSDLIEAFGTDTVKAENHYIGSGYWEGREITYDPVAYLISNSDLGDLGYTPGTVTLQYIAHGYKEGRQESGGFGLEQTNHILPMNYKTWDTIGKDGDRDWFNVGLTAGKTYTFTLSGADGGNGTLVNPFLSLFDDHGHLVASNDGAGHDAKVTFTATASGSFYVVAAASGTGLGTYTLFGATAG